MLNDDALTTLSDEELQQLIIKYSEELIKQYNQAYKELQNK